MLDAFSNDTLQVAVLVLGVGLGIVARTLVPFLQALKQNPNLKFDRAFLIPALMSIVLNLFLMPFIWSTLPAGTTFPVAFLLGWGGQDMSREGVKYFTPDKQQEKTDGS